MGISVVSLGVATGTSVTALGGLQLGTSELFGEDPTGITRIDASQVMR